MNDKVRVIIKYRRRCWDGERVVKKPGYVIRKNARKYEVLEDIRIDPYNPDRLHSHFGALLPHKVEIVHKCEVTYSEHLDELIVEQRNYEQSNIEQD